MEQVGTGGVSPMHVSPNRALGIELKKHVITAAVKDRAIRIIHPVVRGEKVVLRTERIGCKLTQEGIVLRVACKGEARGERFHTRNRNGTSQECASSKRHCPFQ